MHAAIAAILPNDVELNQVQELRMLPLHTQPDMSSTIITICIGLPEYVKEFSKFYRRWKPNVRGT